MNDKSDIAILGASGGTGRPLVEALKARGARVRAIVRRPEATPFDNGVAVRAGDLGDRDSLARALEGCGLVHHIPPVFDDREEMFAANLIAAAAAAGVRRITYHSVLHAPTPAMPHHRRKSLVELMLRESALEWTILQPAMYMQTPLTFLDADVGVLEPAFRPDRPFNPIDLADLTEVAANILTGAGHEFATYELAGSERVDCFGMAAILSAVLDRPVVVRQADASAVAARRGARRGFDARQVEELMAMYRHYDGHGLVGNGNVLTMLLGRTPRGFADAVRRDLLGG